MQQVLLKGIITGTTGRMSWLDMGLEHFGESWDSFTCDTLLLTHSTHSIHMNHDVTQPNFHS